MSDNNERCAPVELNRNFQDSTVNCQHNSPHPINNLAVSEADAAKYIGMSRSYLAQSRMNGNREGRTPAPPYLKIGRSVRYRISDLDTWLEQFRQES